MNDEARAQEDRKWLARKAFSVTNGVVCKVHGGVEMHTYCDGYIGYCDQWDGTYKQGAPAGLDVTCQFDYSGVA